MQELNTTFHPINLKHGKDGNISITLPRCFRQGTLLPSKLILPKHAKQPKSEAFRLWPPIYMW